MCRTVPARGGQRRWRSTPTLAVFDMGTLTCALQRHPLQVLSSEQQLSAQQEVLRHSKLGGERRDSAQSASSRHLAYCSSSVQTAIVPAHRQADQLMTVTFFQRLPLSINRLVLMQAHAQTNYAKHQGHNTCARRAC